MRQFFEEIQKFQLLIIGLLLSLGLVISTVIVTNTLSRSGIDVTGSAVEIVKSDSASWDLEVSAEAKTKKEAYDILSKNKIIVLDYLKDRGFGSSEIDLQNTNSYPVFKKAEKTGENLNEVDYYVSSQIFRITSSNIQLVKAVSLDAESLLEKGVDVRSNPPAYFYTKLSDLKIRLLNAASEDAKKRAQAMLKSTRNSLGGVKSVKTGVFQITTPNSTEVSDWGVYDTSTIDKKVTSVTQVTFKIK